MMAKTIVYILLDKMRESIISMDLSYSQTSRLLDQILEIEKALDEEENGYCQTCKYETNLIPAEPCFSCIHGLCDENPNRTEKWEADEK